MKNVLIVLLTTMVTLTSTVPAFAATVDTSPDANIANNTKYVASEKSDKNTLYYYKEQSEQYSKAYLTYLKKQAKSITDGISDDYGKAKSISSWVSENLWYDGDFYRDGKSIGSVNYFNPADTGDRGADGIEIIAGDKTLCEGYAAFTVALLRADGIPAKEIWGYKGSGSHAWVEAYVDGKWLFIDPTYNSRNNVYKGEWSKQKASDSHYFDLPYETWSLAYHIDTNSTAIVTGEKYVFNGKILFYSSDHNLLKEVSTNLSAGDKLDSTYGFDADKLYKDFACTQPWDLDTDVVKEADTFIVVKDYKSYHYTIYFDSQGGSVVSPISVGAEYKHIWVSMPEPPKPTRDGYDFVGWCPVSYTHSDKPYDFEVEQVSDGEHFYAVWKDKSTGAIAPTTGITTVAPTNTTTTVAPTTTATTTAPIKVTGWSKADGNWRYYDSKGTMQLGWVNDNGTWYHLGGSGVMKTDCWLRDRGKWYYLTANGAMAHDTVIDGYTIGSDGAWINN